MTDKQPPFDAMPEAGMFTADRKIIELKRRLIREASMAISMLETSISALWELDVETARAVRRRDDEIDLEEVEIEQECYEILTLQHPFAKSFRVLAFILKVNPALERVADHATSIAKAVVKIAEIAPYTPTWPTALKELGDRVPAACHEVLRSVMDENLDLAKQIVAKDETIDSLDKQLFIEVRDLIAEMNRTDEAIAMGIHMYRVSRELERVGDLMASVAEELIYLGTGEIVRHAKRREKTK